MSASLATTKKMIVPTIYDHARDAAEFVREMGRAIHSSGMFGCQSPSQGYVLALECAARKCPPLALVERYHLIMGKLSMKSEAMLADFVTDGGSHEVLDRTPDRAAIKLTRNRKSYVFELTWDQALKEPFVYEGKEADVVAKLAVGKIGDLKMKSKYATPRARMQMLWARVVSDAVRAVAPDVTAGRYTPEETADIVDVDVLPSESVGEESPQANAPEATPVTDPEQAEIDALKAKADAQLAASKATETKLMVDAPPEDVKAAAAKAAAFTAAKRPDGLATADQVAKVKTLVAELGVPREKLAAMLLKAKVGKVSDLMAEHCDGLIKVLEEEKARRAAANPPAGQPSNGTGQGASN